MIKRALVITLVLLALSVVLAVETAERQETTTVKEVRDESGPREVPAECRYERFEAIMIDTPSGPVPIAKVVVRSKKTGGPVVEEKYELHPEMVYLLEGTEHTRAFREIWTGLTRLTKWGTLKSMIWSSLSFLFNLPSYLWNNTIPSLRNMLSWSGISYIVGAIPLWGALTLAVTAVWTFLVGLSLGTLVFASLVFGFLYWLVHPPNAKTFNGRRVPLPPGYRFNWGRFKIPILGDTIDALRSPFQFTDNMTKRFGNVSYSNLFFSNSILLSGKEGLQRFFNSELVTRGSTSFPGHISTPIIRGTSDARKLDTKRNVFVKAVHNEDRLVNFLPEIEAAFDKNISEWTQKQDFRFADEFQSLSSELVTKYLLGIYDKDLSSKISDYSSTIISGIGALPLPIPYLFNYGNGMLASWRARKLYTEIIGHHIAGRTEYSERYPYIRKGSAMDVISTEIKRNYTLTMKEATLVMSDMMISSSYMIGNALTDMMICFSRYPDVLNKARFEVQNNFQPYDKITVDKLQNLPYIDSIIEEIRRCFAFVPYQAGVAKKDFELNGRLVPKGYKVLGCFYAANHDYELWSQPYSFRPERFARGEPKTGEIYPLGSKNQVWSWVPPGTSNDMTSGPDLTTYILKVAAIEILRKGCVWDAPSQDVRKKLSLFKPRPENGFNVRNFRSQEVSHA
jgi:cytochrome P450